MWESSVFLGQPHPISRRRAPARSTGKIWPIVPPFTRSPEAIGTDTARSVTFDFWLFSLLQFAIKSTRFCRLLCYHLLMRYFQFFLLTNARSNDNQCRRIDNFIAMQLWFWVNTINFYCKSQAHTFLNWIKIHFNYFYIVLTYISRLHQTD